MTYEEMVELNMPRWVVVDLDENEVLAETWTWSNASFAALQAERCRYMHSIRIYDRMDVADLERLGFFKEG